MSFPGSPHQATIVLSVRCRLALLAPRQSHKCSRAVHALLYPDAFTMSGRVFHALSNPLLRFCRHVRSSVRMGYSHSSVDGSLDCFQFQAFLNEAVHGLNLVSRPFVDLGLHCSYVNTQGWKH